MILRHLTFTWSLTWREIDSDSNCTITSVFNQILSLIPETIPDHLRLSPKHFIRDRLLPYPQLVSLLLSTAASDKECGLGIKVGDFFKHAKRSGLLPDAKACDASAVRRARKKIPWQAFEEIFYNAVDLANRLWDKQSWHQWHNMSVYAIDGSKYKLPATEDIRKEFDPTSGFDNKSIRHYPLCLVSTAYDVFKRLPVAYTIASYGTSERDEAKLILPHIPSGGVIILDRGYPGYSFFSTLLSEYDGFFVIRCRTTKTFPAVEKFVHSGKEQALIEIAPPVNYLKSCSLEQKTNARPICLRAIRLESPDGTVSVLLTNMIDAQQYPHTDIRNLYFERYRIEEYYRHEKVIAVVENFHTKSSNGIRQEILAVAIVSVISRLLINLTGNSKDDGRIEPQFKNAVISLAKEAFLLTPLEPRKALQIFKELLNQIERVKYYKPIKKRPSYPRICKRSPNKWCKDRTNKNNNYALSKP